MAFLNNPNFQGMGLVRFIIGLLLVLALLALFGIVSSVVDQKWVEAIIILAILFLLFG